MKKFYTFLFLISCLSVLRQSIDKSFSKKKMRNDLEVFKEIRLKANSGLYKYRTELLPNLSQTLPVVPLTIKVSNI